MGVRTGSSASWSAFSEAPSGAFIAALKLRSLPRSALVFSLCCDFSPESAHSKSATLPRWRVSVPHPNDRCKSRMTIECFNWNDSP